MCIFREIEVQDVVCNHDAQVFSFQVLQREMIKLLDIPRKHHLFSVKCENNTCHK